MKKLTKYFLRGLLVLVPSTLTVFAIFWAIMSFDSLSRRLFRINIPGLGLILTAGLILVLGYLASNFAGRKIFGLIDKIFARLPLVKLLYSAIKDFTEAFAGDKKSFDKPVLIELTPNGPKALGFITKDELSSLGLTDHVAVYMPQSYNFAGQMLILPAERVKVLNIDSAETMKFIVSGGVSGK